MHPIATTMIAVGMLATGGAVTTVSAEAALEKRGAALLASNCIRCHAVGRSDASPHPAAPPFRTLSRKYPIDGLAEALAEGLSVGHTDMPEFRFEAGDIGAILAYLKSIQQP